MGRRGVGTQESEGRDGQRQRGRTAGRQRQQDSANPSPSGPAAADYHLSANMTPTPPVSTLPSSWARQATQKNTPSQKMSVKSKPENTLSLRYNRFTMRYCLLLRCAIVCASFVRNIPYYLCQGYPVIRSGTGPTPPLCLLPVTLSLVNDSSALQSCLPLDLFYGVVCKGSERDPPFLFCSGLPHPC